MVPGKDAGHAGRNAHGAERADEQDALARAGNLAGLQGFLHPLVRNPSFRGIAHIQGFLDAGGNREGGFPARLACGNQRRKEVVELFPPFVARLVDHGIGEHVVFIKLPRNLAGPGELAAGVQRQADFPVQPFFRNRFPVLRGHVGAQEFHSVRNGVMGGAESGGQAQEKGGRQRIHEHRNSYLNSGRETSFLLRK